jgi:hypothetical protein
MAKIYTREEVNKIINNDELSADEKTERLFSLYGRALDDGYISKSAAQQAQASAIEAAKAEAVKNIQAPDVTQSAEYQKVAKERDMLRAIGGDDFATVKPKFRETVFGMLDRSEKAPAIADQLKTIWEKYEEYFTAGKQQEAGPAKPNFGAPTQGSAPSGKTGPSFMDTWGYVPKKN